MSKSEQFRRNEKEWKSEREIKKCERVKEKRERMNKWKKNEEVGTSERET